MGVDNLHDRKQLQLSSCGVLPNRGANGPGSTVVKQVLGGCRGVIRRAHRVGSSAGVSAAPIILSSDLDILSSIS